MLRRETTEVYSILFIRETLQLCCLCSKHGAMENVSLIAPHVEQKLLGLLWHFNILVIMFFPCFSAREYSHKYCPWKLSYSISVLGYNRLCGLVVRVPGYRTRGPGFDTRRYQIFWEVVGLERGPLSLVRINEELLERTVAATVYKTEIKSRGDSLRWPHNLYPLKLALTSPISGGRSFGIVRWRTKHWNFLYQY
jgi:hypothetical protein